MTDPEKTFFEQLDEVDAILKEANATVPDPEEQRWAERPSGSIDGPMNLKSAMAIAEIEPGTTIHSSDPRGS